MRFKPKEKDKPDLNKPVFHIFPEKRKLAENWKCVECGRDVRELGFKGKNSLKEYSISGLCENCQQNRFFK